MTLLDWLALLLFFCGWFGLAFLTNGRLIKSRLSLSRIMAERRRAWIFNALKRDLRMIDTQILAGLQNGTAFFASTSIIAIGGCFAMLGATEKVDLVLRDLPLFGAGGRAAF
ncbi:DUF599 family protein [Agrobacterium vitis]|nr:DUF599 family protein [Agrobacterium vitis]MUZ55204.1 DUF599 family protein [Agrobacterium vitis]